MAMVPGANNPNKKREKANTQKLGEKALSKAINMDTRLAGFITLLRPYLSNARLKKKMVFWKQLDLFSYVELFQKYWFITK